MLMMNKLLKTELHIFIRTFITFPMQTEQKLTKIGCHCMVQKKNMSHFYS